MRQLVLASCTHRVLGFACHCGHRSKPGEGSDGEGPQLSDSSDQATAAREKMRKAEMRRVLRATGLVSMPFQEDDCIGGATKLEGPKTTDAEGMSSLDKPVQVCFGPGPVQAMSSQISQQLGPIQKCLLAAALLGCHDRLCTGKSGK